MAKIMIGVKRTEDKKAREVSRMTSNHQFKFLGRQYYRVRHTDLKSLAEDDNTIEAFDAYTIIVWQIKDIN